MTKILAIAPYTYLPVESGGQKYIARFFEHLGKLMPLFVVSTQKNQLPKNGSYQFFPLFSNSFLRYINPFNYFFLRKLIKKNHITHLLIEHPYMGWLAIILAKTTGIKLIVQTHNIEYQRFKTLGKWWWPILKIYETSILRNADKVTAITANDLNFMQLKMGILSNKLLLVPFGTDCAEKPTNKQAAREMLLKQYNIATNAHILLFNGAMNYEPNAAAAKVIVQQIVPSLLQKGIEFHCFITGKNFPDSLLNNLPKSVTVTGFVEDIAIFFTGADVFLNTVTAGGGIKTKVIEALSYNCTVISTKEGAIGIDLNLVENKLIISDDNNWHFFTQKIIEVLQSPSSDINSQFYQQLHWPNVAKSFIDSII
ncbi:MAG: glycosyltransferase family 4 protein [Chitinophagaceae bacterium]